MDQAVEAQIAEAEERLRAAGCGLRSSVRMWMLWTGCWLRG